MTDGAAVDPPAPLATIDGEDVLFNEGGIIITKTRLISGPKIFPISGVTSIRRGMTPPSRGGPAVLFCLSILPLFGALPAVEAGQIATALVLALIGLSLIAAGTWVWRSQRPIFTLLLTTAGGEVEAYSTHSSQFVEEVIQSLNRAIIARG